VNRNVNILTGDDFRRANGVLKAMIKKFLVSGQKKIDLYPRITSNDMSLLRQYFDRSTNKRLQEEIIFNIILYFGFRGRENLRYFDNVYKILSKNMILTFLFSIQTPHKRKYCI
jgi:hypothetical protein